MNYTSEELFDKVILNDNSFLSEYEREKIVEDLLYLQGLLHPYGILKETSVEKLILLDSSSLVSIHTWQNEMFAIKHFRECGKTHHLKTFLEYILGKTCNNYLN